MERTDVLELMSTLKLYGMRAAYDEVMTTGIKRRHEPARIVGDLLSAEIAEKQARSIKYQLTIAKLPLAKDIDDFDFADTPVNEALIRDLASGAFLTAQRNVVLVGGTGTGKSHLAIAIARACIRGGARGRFYTVVERDRRVPLSEPGNLGFVIARRSQPSVVFLSSRQGWRSIERFSVRAELVNQKLLGLSRNRLR
jgi:DNA replication protein DnaC